MNSLMNLLFKVLRRWPVELALWVAALLELVAVAAGVVGMLWPIPWVVVAAMTIGPTFVGLGVVLYAISVGADVVRVRDQGGAAGPGRA